MATNLGAATRSIRGYLMVFFSFFDELGWFQQSGVTRGAQDSPSS
jgi:hypothetical protein